MASGPARLLHKSLITMTSLPSILILTNRGHLVAYRSTQNGSLQQFDSLEPMEGNRSISDLVTDQAGAFPTDGPGMSSYESLPLIEELEIRADRQIAGKIEAILEAQRPYSWGFAAAPEINAGILDLLGDEWKRNLVCNFKLDLTNSPPGEVRTHFEEQTLATFN